MAVPMRFMKLTAWRTTRQPWRLTFLGVSSSGFSFGRCFDWCFELEKFFFLGDSGRSFRKTFATLLGLFVGLSQADSLWNSDAGSFNATLGVVESTEHGDFHGDGVRTRVTNGFSREGRKKAWELKSEGNSELAFAMSVRDPCVVPGRGAFPVARMLGSNTSNSGSRNLPFFRLTCVLC